MQGIDLLEDSKFLVIAPFNQKEKEIKFIYFYFILKTNEDRK